MGKFLQHLQNSILWLTQLSAAYQELQNPSLFG